MPHPQSHLIRRLIRSHPALTPWAAQTGQTVLRPVFWVKRFSDFLGLEKLFTNLKIPSAFLKLER